MKKVLMAVAVAVMFCSMAFAGAYEDGMKLYQEKKYAEAIVELQKALPTLEGAQKSNAQLHIGYSFYLQKKYAEAIVEFRKVVSIEGAHPHHLSNAQLHIGYSFYLQKKYAEAIVEFRKVVSIEGAHPHHLSKAQLYSGLILLAQGKNAEAQEAFLNGCVVEGASVAVLKANFNNVSRTALGIEKYKELLDKMIFIIPAIPANADFLGELKSEQEKLK